MAMMRITIESVAPGLFRVDLDQDGKHRQYRDVSRFEAEIFTARALDRENRRNRVADRLPWMETTIHIPIPKWFPWPRRRADG